MTASEQIDQQIASLHDWRGERYSQLRSLINATDPGLPESWKWGTAVWSLNGLVCAVSTFRKHIKINFFKGARLHGKKNLFDSGLDSKEHRSINFGSDDSIDEAAIRTLLQEAISLNKS